MIWFNVIGDYHMGSKRPTLKIEKLNDEDKNFVNSYQSFDAQVVCSQFAQTSLILSFLIFLLMRRI